jgi:methyl-accepting chemotaxis protein
MSFIFNADSLLARVGRPSTARTGRGSKPVIAHMGFLDNISVKTKVFGGFGVVLAILGVLGAVSYFSAREIVAEVEDYRHVADIGFDVDDVFAALLEMRRYARELGLTGQPEAADKAKKAAETFQSELADATAEIKDPARTEAILDVAKNAEAYLAALNQLIALQADRRAVLKASQQAVSGEAGQPAPEVNASDLEKIRASEAKVQELLDGQMSPLGYAMQDKIKWIMEHADKNLEQLETSMFGLMALVSTLTLALSIGALILGAGLAWLIGGSISSGILGITGAMRELAGGNKAVNVPYRERKDEVGAMAAALQVFKDTAIEADRMAAEQRAEQEKRVKRSEYVTKLVADFSDAIKEIVSGVGSGATQLRANAQALSAIAEETNSQSTTVAAAAEQASRSVQTVASAADELNSSISEINRQIDGSARLANSAVGLVKNTNDTVETLSAAAQEIGNVVQLIQDIAAQTNLLALNATIEAARAGEAGKGFAVVASEVKSLANQTAKATEDISAQINRIQGVASQSVQAMGEVGKSVSQISEATTTVASAAQEQAAATAEISRSVQQVSAGTTEVASNIVHVTKAAGETGQMSTQVYDASTNLTKQSEQLRTVVGRFIEQVKAA